MEFKPYQAQISGLNERQITTFCEQVNVAHRNMDLVSPFALYDDILSHIMRSPYFKIRPLRELPNQIAKKSRKTPNPISRVGLRHDMDGDIITGLKCAQRLSSRRIAGSFFILHTSGYYGEFKDGVFNRYPGLQDIIQKFSTLRIELGLHNDGFSYYQDHEVNGTESVSAEIAWLRAQDINVSSVVAHNSAPAYGAENFEMFRGLALKNRTSVTHNGVQIPLQTLSLSAQDIHYEGNFSLPPRAENYANLDAYISNIEEANIRNPKWQDTHFLNNPTFERNYDISIWLLACDSWLMAIHTQGPKLGQRRLYWPLSTQALKQHLDGLTPGYRIMINIHPEYIAL